VLKSEQKWRVIVSERDFWTENPWDSCSRCLLPVAWGSRDALCELIGDHFYLLSFIFFYLLLSAKI